MVTAQSLVDSSTRQVLVDQAQELGLSVKDEDGKPLNKLELAEAILEAEAESDDEPVIESEIDPEPESEVEEVEEDPEPESEEEQEDDSDDEDVLVRFVGANPVLEVAGKLFKKDSPFKVLSAENAQEVFDSKHGNKFRAATPREAQEFYS